MGWSVFEIPESFGFHHFPEGFDGEADDAGDGFLVAFDDEVAVFLDSVAACFVQGMDFGEVVGDGFFAEGFEGHLVGDHVGFLEAAS